MMNANILNNVFTIIILGAGLFLGFLSNGYRNKLKDIYEKMDKAINKRGKILSTRTLDARRVDIDDISGKEINDYRLDFYDCCINCDIVSRMIPLFPMAGILGTVLGLIYEVKANTDIQNIFSSLDLALRSTALALLCAILLKFFENIWLQRNINKIEMLFDDFDRSMNYSIQLGDIAATDLKE